MDNTIFSKETPADPTRKFWWDWAVYRKDWYLLIVKDDISELEYPVFVRQFDAPKFPYYKYHLQNDQRVLVIYETSRQEQYDRPLVSIQPRQDR